jgi:hypothetical protein
MTRWHGFGSILLGFLTRSTSRGGSRMAFLDDMMTFFFPWAVRAIAQIASWERRRDWEGVDLQDSNRDDAVLSCQLKIPD